VLSPDQRCARRAAPRRIDVAPETPYLVGVSGVTAESTGISMNLIATLLGRAAQPHIYHGYERAIYVLKCTARTLYEPGLKEKVITAEGDFVFIAANVPRQPINTGATEPVYAIVARNEPNEQEYITHYDPNDKV